MRSPTSPVGSPAGPAPLGSCSAALVVPALPATIIETIPSGTTLASVSTLPGAGLLISSARRLLAVNPGFDPNNLLTADISYPRKPASVYPKNQEGQRQEHHADHGEALHHLIGAMAHHR